MSFARPDSDASDWLEGGLETFGDLGYPLYRRLFDEDQRFVVSLDRKLAESRMATPVELYLSRALAVGGATGLLLWTCGLLVGYLLFAYGGATAGPLLGLPVENGTLLAVILALRTPAMVLGTGLICGSIGFALGFGGLVSIPHTRAYSRRREINMLLPDAVSYMYALAVGGLNQLEIIEEMARADDTYGAVAQEFRCVLKETEYFDTDYRTAIRTQADVTPSEGLRALLIDMLSIINSGGDMTRFFDDQQHKHLRTAEQEQEKAIETLELFAEMYLTVSLFPLLLIIVFVVMRMLGNLSSSLLFLAVYVLIPITAVVFLGLVATVKQDELGEGVITPFGESEWLEAETRTSPWSRGLIDAFVGGPRVFDRIREREGTYELRKLLRRPHHFFRDHPQYTLAVSVPAAVAFVVGLAFFGAVPTTWDGLVRRPIWGTFVLVYAPLYIVGVPLAAFYEWNVRSRFAVIDTLTDDLRKLASVNDTGMTLLESIGTVGETSSGRLAREFREMYGKVHYGMSLNESLVEFNNRYRIPRLSRTVKLISKSQETSSHITKVLTTAARSSENQDDLGRDLRTRTRIQVVIVMMTFLTMLGVMAILKTQFIDVMAGLTGARGGDVGYGGAVDPAELSLLFFHAITLQAILAGVISGYVRHTALRSGVKYVLALASVALVVWTVVS